MSEPLNTIADAPLVTLTPSELTIASTVAVMRQVTNLRDGRKDAHGADLDKGWQLHIEGACGELAVAKFLNVYWSGQLGNLKADDVGNLQVRTAAAEGSRLIVHPDDPDDRVFVLALGRAPTFRLAGWVYGRDAKQEKWWDDPVGGRPAFFVKVARLKPVSLLVRLLNGEAPAPVVAEAPPNLF